MAKLSEELESALSRLVDEKMGYNYAPKDLNEQWVYEEFAQWLVKKFKEERNA